MYIRNPETNEWEEVFLPPTGDTYPIGMYGYFAGENAPTNWLRCDGQLVLKTEYPELFNAIGTIHNKETDTDETKFRLPNVNLEHRTLVGSSGDGEFSVGNKMGEEKHTLAKNELPNGVIVNAAGTIHVTTSGNNTVQTLNTGNQPFNIMQPSMASVCCIKAKQSAGIVGDVTNNINDTNENAVPNAKTVKDYVDEKNTYSTNEKVVGTWIDGKPIYRKVVDFGTLPNNTVKGVQHGIQNLKKFIFIGGATTSSTGASFTLPSYRFNDINGIEIWVTTTEIAISTGTDRTNSTAYIVLEYTKTTDDEVAE